MINTINFIKKCNIVKKLIRLDQPIGLFLLLWPTLWGLWLVNRGAPNLKFLLIFVLGVICMRSAGCIINDYVDRDIDVLVRRTKNRPLSSKIIEIKLSLIVLMILLIISIVLVSLFSIKTILLSIVSLILIVIYPYLKRYIYFPQIMLGILFSWPIVIVFSANNYGFTKIFWWLFLANTMWVMSYDTQYATMDVEDDIHIGIKSFAVLFGKKNNFMIGLFQVMTLFFLVMVGIESKFSIIFYFFSLFLPSLLFIWQQFLIRDKQREKYLFSFLSNNYVGMLIFLGIVLDFYFY